MVQILKNRLQFVVRARCGIQKIGQLNCKQKKRNSIDHKLTTENRSFNQPISRAKCVAPYNIDGSPGEPDGTNCQASTSCSSSLHLAVMPMLSGKMLRSILRLVTVT